MHACKEISGAFYFQVVSFPDWQEDIGVYFNNIEADIRNTISDWEEIGFSDEDLAMVKTEKESQNINTRQIDIMTSNNYKQTNCIDINVYMNYSEDNKCEQKSDVVYNTHDRRIE